MLISLKFIISDRLPKISYFSLLDKYITLSYLIMVLLILHVCIGLPFLSDDSVVFIFFCVIWVAVHVLVMWKYHTSNDWEVWRNRINTLKSLNKWIMWIKSKCEWTLTIANENRLWSGDMICLIQPISGWDIEQGRSEEEIVAAVSIYLLFFCDKV